MVSGLVTSPCDQLRIFSGLASWILMASKSAMGPVSSKGLERNIFCVSLVFCVVQVQRLGCGSRNLVAMTFGASRYRWFWCSCFFRLSCHLSGGLRRVRSDLLRPLVH